MKTKRQLLSAIENIVKEFIDENGGTFTVHTANRGGSHQIVVAMKTGVETQLQESMFRAQAEKNGVDPDLWGKTFKDGPRRFKIVGFNANASRSPIQIENVATGKPFRCGWSFVRFAE